MKTPQFRIYKKGTTETRLTICSSDKSFNRDAKIKFYLSLGYEVYDLNDIRITA